MKCHRAQFRNWIYWIFWSIGVAVIIVAVSLPRGAGLQLVSEGYLMLLALGEIYFTLGIAFSASFRDKWFMQTERRRVPASISVASLAVTGLAGYMLGNWIIVLSVVLSLVLFPRTEHFREEMRIRSFPLRVMRDGTVHKDELRH